MMGHPSGLFVVVLVFLSSMPQNPVLGVPLPAVLPTDLVPLGVNAPIQCPPLPSPVDPVDPVEPVDPVDPTCGSLDADIHERISQQVEGSIREQIRLYDEAAMLEIFTIVDDAAVALTAIPDPQAFMDGLAASITGATTGLIFDPSAMEENVRIAVLSDLIVYIQGRSYNCDITLSDIKASLDSYLTSDALLELIFEQANLVSNSREEAVDVLIADSAADAVFITTLRPLILDAYLGIPFGGLAFEPPIIASLETTFNNILSTTVIPTTIILTNNAGNNRRKRQIDSTLDRELSEVIEEVAECSICGTVRNAIDEIIVNTMNDILATADPVTFAIDEATIPDTVTAAITSQLIEQSFSEAIDAGIVDGSLRSNLIQKIIELLLDVNPDITVIDFEDFQSSIDFETAAIEETVNRCVTSYLGDSDAIESAISSAITNAVINNIADAAVAPSISLPVTCEAIVNSINPALESVDITTLTPSFEVPIENILSFIRDDESIKNIIIDINRRYVEAIITPIFEKFNLPPNVVDTLLRTVNGLLDGLTGGIENGGDLPLLLTDSIKSLLNAYEETGTIPSLLDIYKIILSDADTPLVGLKAAPKNKNFLSKKVLKFKPFVKKLLKLAKKVTKSAFNRNPLALSTEEKIREKRELVSNSMSFFRKMYGSAVSGLSSVGDEFSEVGVWLTNFPPYVTVYDTVNEFSVENLRKDFIAFLAGFDFFDIETLENFTFDNIVDTITSYEFGDIIIDYLTQLENYIDSINVGVVDSIKGFEKKMLHIKDKMFPFLA